MQVDIINIFKLIKTQQFNKIINIIKKKNIKNLDIKDSNKNYFIQYIITYNQYKLLKIILQLIKQNIITMRLDILDLDGRSLLYNCIKFNYIELLNLILQYNTTNIGISILDLKDRLGLTALHYSVIFNNYKLLLMKYGGQDLQAFGEHVHKWKKTSNNIKKLELFWLEVSRLFRGLNAFNKAGVVHHDLKHPNIVYDEKSHRINFIDFGFMSKKNDIIKNCKASDYWLSKQLHWSFPFEIILWNKDTYSKYATGAASKLAKDFSDASLDMSKPTGYFFTTITDFKPNTPEYKRISENMFKQFFKMSMELDMKGYDDFLNKSIDTIDSYGVGIALMFMLRKSKHLLNRKFSEKAFNLFQNMIHPNVYSRHNTNVLIFFWKNSVLYLKNG
mgnify:CR=1 FL=1